MQRNFDDIRECDDADSQAKKKIKKTYADGKAVAVKKRNFPLVSKKSVLNKFQQGDLVFGLAKKRQDIVDNLTTHGFTYIYANALNDTVVEAVIELSKKSFSTVKEAHYQFLMKFRDYLLKKPGKTIPTRPNEPTIGAAFRRACKLLLINRDPNRTYKTHVVTLGVNWQRVCAKDSSDIGVTNSELRAAYRDEKKHGINPYILFYDDKHKLMKFAPWYDKEIAPHFEEYDRKREKKSRV